MGTRWQQLGRAVSGSFLQNYEEQSSGQDYDRRRVARLRRFRAKWGLNRHMQNGCGKTLDETMNLYERYYNGSNPLPFLLIETWNDYEEGTAIEQRTAANCGGTATGASTESTSQ